LLDYSLEFVVPMTASLHIPARILVADDDPQVLSFVETVLVNAGYTVVTAVDGKEAYKLLQGPGTFDAAVLDIVMPHIEGRDLVRHMQTEKRLMKIPVIIMTGQLDSRMSSESFSAGAVAFLPKPFPDSQLLTMLRMFVPSGLPASKP
jgi:CheY-like chemotaxis protein